LGCLRSPESLSSIGELSLHKIFQKLKISLGQTALGRPTHLPSERPAITEDYRASAEHPAIFFDRSEVHRRATERHRENSENYRRISGRLLFITVHRHCSLTMSGTMNSSMTRQHDVSKTDTWHLSESDTWQSGRYRVKYGLELGRIRVGSGSDVSMISAG
jgi:hypothetical protein